MSTNECQGFGERTRWRARPHCITVNWRTLRFVVDGNIGSADIHVAPGNRFLYASNRGDANSIAIFAIDPVTGKLTLKGTQPTGGKTPRNFLIDPTGHWLLAANQNGNSVVIFKIDPATGMLTDTHNRLDIPAPVCLKMEKVN